MKPLIPRTSWPTAALLCAAALAPPAARAADNSITTPDAAAAEQPRTIHLAYFGAPGCGSCEAAAGSLEKLKEDTPHLEIETYDWTTPKVKLMMAATLHRLGVSSEDIKGPPVIVIGTDVIGPEDIAEDTVKRVLAKYASTGAPRTWNIAERAKEEVRVKTRWRHRSLPASVLDAGVRDGYSPWAFGGAIVLLLGLRLLDRRPREALAAALAFVGGAFAMYFAIGVFFRPALAVVATDEWGATVANAWQWLPAIRIAQRVIAIVAGLASLLVACLALLRYRHMAEGRAEEPPSTGPAARALDRALEWARGSRGWVTLLIPALLGIVASLVELIWTGRLYGPAIELLQQDARAGANLPLWVLLYNLAWLAPLLGVTAVAYILTQSASICRAASRHSARVVFAAAVCFAVLAFILLASASAAGV